MLEWVRVVIFILVSFNTLPNSSATPVNGSGAVVITPLEIKGESSSHPHNLETEVGEKRTHPAQPYKLHRQHDAIAEDLQKIEIHDGMSGEDINQALGSILSKYSNRGGRVTWQARMYLEQIGIEGTVIDDFLLSRKRQTAREQAATRRHRMRETGFTDYLTARTEWVTYENAKFASFLSEKGFDVQTMTPKEFNDHWIKTDTTQYSTAEFGHRLGVHMKALNVPAEWREEYTALHGNTLSRQAWRRAYYRRASAARMEKEEESLSVKEDIAPGSPTRVLRLQAWTDQKPRSMRCRKLSGRCEVFDSSKEGCSSRGREEEFASASHLPDETILEEELAPSTKEYRTLRKKAMAVVHKKAFLERRERQRSGKGKEVLEGEEGRSISEEEGERDEEETAVIRHLEPSPSWAFGKPRPARLAASSSRGKSTSQQRFESSIPSGPDNDGDDDRCNYKGKAKVKKTTSAARMSTLPRSSPQANPRPTTSILAPKGYRPNVRWPQRR
ncbi:hypothetical protein CBS101457_002791 [Exobasidium rhododendri]|nr:hypothetical protein CBS101457_002791 [Exobasidium rhododendri]